MSNLKENNSYQVVRQFKTLRDLKRYNIVTDLNGVNAYAHVLQRKGI